MPIQIGESPESDFTDPIGMLGDCHRRIVRFLQILVALSTRHKGEPLSDEHRTLLSRSLRYFREGAPKHTADEEESLFPRLRSLVGTDVDMVLARIDSLEQDHEGADRSHVEVDLDAGVLLEVRDNFGIKEVRPGEYIQFLGGGRGLAAPTRGERSDAGEDEHARRSARASGVRHATPR